MSKINPASLTTIALVSELASRDIMLTHKALVKLLDDRMDACVVMGIVSRDGNTHEYVEHIHQKDGETDVLNKLLALFTTEMENRAWEEGEDDYGE